MNNSLKTLFLLPLLLTFAATTLFAGDKPDIVVFMIDDLGWNPKFPLHQGTGKSAGPPPVLGDRP